ncbi:MAG: transcription termination/antitermination protein NusG [Clostridia bacterium]
MVELAKWYVVNTYSGYEKNVCKTIRQAVENRKMKSVILETVIPEEKVIEFKNGQEVEVSRKLFPGYVMIKMILNDDSWVLIRNTRGVTGFVGADAKPTPLTDEEVKYFGIENYDSEESERPVEVVIPYEVSDGVRVITGPLEGLVGVVKSIDKANGTAMVLISDYGRETLVELGLASIKTIV